MKKIAMIVAMAVALTGCGEPLEVVESKNDGSFTTKVYPTYGFFNEGTLKSDKMCYEVSVGNVVWSIVLMETIIAPIYFIGFSLFNPTGYKVDGKCGIDSK
jgi:PBP1b-binding outer membrane lipoprotein LpoB